MLVLTATALFKEQCAIAILANLPERIDSRERRENVEALSERTILKLQQLITTLRENVEQKLVVRYETKDEINAFRHDLDFVRKGSRGIRRQVAS